MSRLIVIVLVIGALVVGGVVAAVAMEARVAAPARSALHFPWGMLASESETMNDCVECHEPEKFHTCETCHDDHGSAEMALMPFNNLILLVGDVPEPRYIPVNEILPYRDQPGTHIRLADLLATYGVETFETVTITSRDGGFVTIDRENLTDEALLMPHVDGVRFAAENLHVSTWLKGIWRIVVVGPATPLRVDGEATSIGRLLLGPTTSVTVEQTDVMLKSETDGQVRRAKTAGRMEGAAVGSLVKIQDFRLLVVTDATGQEHVVEGWQAQGALLVQPMGPGIDGVPPVMLVLPERSRASWVANVVEIRSEE
ncbi:MAG: hypothetical protein JXA93_24545 [Anaerolineae bacterium]|nr:hypothetical protein [Anaerolineae bacterium]